MSRPDADTGDGPDDRIAERMLRQEEFADDLNAQGYTDVLILRWEKGRDVLPDGLDDDNTVPGYDAVQDRFWAEVDQRRPAVDRCLEPVPVVRELFASSACLLAL